jgi:TonB family protein
MRYAPVLMSLAALTLGCASGSESQQAANRPTRRGPPRAAPAPTFESSTGARQMGLENEAGVYEGQDIEETMHAHMKEVRGCYERAGHAQRYAAGKVTLRFAVSGDGSPREVLVVASELGNFDVERCVVEVCRRVKFPPPEGHKATTFEYPVEFRSTDEVRVQDLDDSAKLDHDVATLLHSLAACGPITDTGASALFYIEPNGSISSVGLSADSALDEHASTCTIKEMRHWKMSATLPGRVLRCRVNIPAVIAAAEPAPRAPIARKRRR